jgi:hypothetical protein
MLANSSIHTASAGARDVSRLPALYYYFVGGPITGTTGDRITPPRLQCPYFDPLG